MVRQALVPALPQQALGQLQFNAQRKSEAADAAQTAAAQQCAALLLASILPAS